MAEGAMVELWAEAPDPARFRAHDVGGMEDPGTVHDCTTDRCDLPPDISFRWGVLGALGPVRQVNAGPFTQGHLHFSPISSI